MPHISIVIPVLNESDRIDQIIAHVRALDHTSEVEIIVVDGDGTGNTLHSITHKNITGVISRPGRGPQMNAGAAHATGEIILFLHADTELPGNGLAMASAAMENPTYKAGAFALGINAKGLLFRAIEWGSFLRAHISRVPFGDQAIFMRRDYFLEIGGYRDIPIMEDVDLMARIRSKGHTIVLIPAKVRTSARRWQKEGVVACMLRNWILRAFYVFKVPPEKLAKFYPKE